MIRPYLNFLPALLAGIATVGAFAPFGWYLLVVPALALLFYQWSRDTPRVACLRGALFGIGLFGAGVSWVYVSIHTYGNVPVVLSGLIALLLILVMAAFPALAGYLARRCCPGPGAVVMVLAMPSAWLLSEWLRGWLLSGFPWLNLGASQIDGPLAGYLALTGEYGVTWLLACTAGVFAAVLRQPGRFVLLLVPVLLWVAGELLGRVAWTVPRGAPLRVAVVQGNVAQDQKWLPENLESTLQRYLDMTFDGEPSDLYLWPETAIPAFYDQVDEVFIPALTARLEERGAALLTGIPVLDREHWRYYNSVISLADEPHFYYKQHLVPFGEYVPLRPLLGFIVDKLVPMNGDFSRGGPDQPLLQAGDLPVGATICFEVVFSRLIAAQARAAALLVNVSNDGWFGDSLAPHQHLEIARVRARETGRAMLRATNTGISAIIDPQGNIAARSRQFEQAVVRGTVTPSQGNTPFVLLGNWPVLMVALVALMVARLAGRRAR